MYQSLTLLTPNPGPLIGAEGGNNDISHLLEATWLPTQADSGNGHWWRQGRLTREDSDSSHLWKQGGPRILRHRELQNLIKDVRETKGIQLHVPTLYISKTLFHQTYC